MKQLVMFSVLLFLTINTYSQTTIPAGGIKTTTWTKEGSPYFVQGKIIVPKGETLTINSGVEIRLKASKNKRKVGTILVYGTIEALGNKEFPILFTKTNNTGDWGSVYIVESEKSIFEYCNFEYSGGQMNAEEVVSKSAKGAISIEKSNPKLSNVKISNSFIGIYCISESSPIISKCVIESCYIAIELFKNSNAILTNSVISGSGSGIYCHNSNSIINNCNILNNRHSGISYDNGSKIEVNRSIFWGNKVAFIKYRNDPIFQSVIQPQIEIDNPIEKAKRLETQNIVGIPPDDVDFTEKLRFDITSNTTYKVSGKEIIIGSQISENEVKPLINKKNSAEVVEKNTKELKESDVDLNIPINNNKSDYRFALIIGNEDYKSYQTGLKAEQNVEFAVNDAEVFKKYCINALGIPEENVIFETNIGVVRMKQAFNQISSIIKNLNGEAEIIIYYAGHGFPDEKTKEPYLIPVDVSSNSLELAINLKDLYTQLTINPSKRVLVFLDACFTGGGRKMGLLASRGVKIKPNENVLTGNLVVFNASSENQSALPYYEKGHGMFTYFLLKKIQETNGDLSLKDLDDYLHKNISIKSSIINNREQNPHTNISSGISNKWSEWKL